jgi:hypothetical protein
VSSYLAACAKQGVRETFHPVALRENKNMEVVVKQLLALEKHIQLGFETPIEREPAAAAASLKEDSTERPEGFPRTILGRPSRPNDSALSPRTSQLNRMKPSRAAFETTKNIARRGRRRSGGGDGGRSVALKFLVSRLADNQAWHYS